MTMYANISAMHIPTVQCYAETILKRCLDRGCTLDYTRTNTKLQVQASHLVQAFVTFELK